MGELDLMVERASKPVSVKYETLILSSGDVSFWMIESPLGRRYAFSKSNASRKYNDMLAAYLPSTPERGQLEDITC